MTIIILRKIRMKSTNQKICISVTGVFLGLLCSLGGSVIFSMAILGDLSLTFGSFVVSSLPAAFGGLYIIHFLNLRAAKRKLTIGISSVLGLLIGFLAGLVPTLIIAILLLMTRKVPVMRLVELSFIALSISTFLGGFSGIVCFPCLNYLIKNGNEIRKLC